MESSENTTDSSQSTTKLTFGFSKKLAQPKVLEKSAISDPSALQEKEETDFVLEVNNAGVKGTLVKEEKKRGPLVIPCKAVNDWTKRPTPTRDGEVEKTDVASKGGSAEKEERTLENGEPKSAEDEAVKELLDEAE